MASPVCCWLSAVDVRESGAVCVKLVCNVAGGVGAAPWPKTVTSDVADMNSSFSL